MLKEAVMVSVEVSKQAGQMLKRISREVNNRR